VVARSNTEGKQFLTRYVKKKPKARFANHSDPQQRNRVYNVYDTSKKLYGFYPKNI
jgi:hypothetical protein